jgi:small subunit ribosomal protein S4
MRALGLDLPGLTAKTSERRPYPPGQHGQRRRKETEYGKRLKEKQKLRLNYGLSERQLRKLFHEALASRTNTGTKLIELLERRLDNIVFRAGYARSIPQARQLVNHGHVIVNGRRVDIPSYRLKVGELVSIKPSSRDAKPVVDGIAHAERRLWQNAWLEIDHEARSVKILQLPDETAVPFQLEVHLVVELYALSA